MTDNTAMSGKERIARIMKRQPVDRIGLNEYYWSDTLREYARQGYMKPDEPVEDHFGLDIQIFRPFNMTLDLDFERRLVGETETTEVYRDGNGAVLRTFKSRNSPPENIDFAIKEKDDWDKVRHLLINTDKRRVDFEGYRNARAIAENAGRYFCCAVFGPFALTQPVSGPENVLAGIALEPDWVLDMTGVYSDLIIRLQETLFEAEGYPDAVWYYEDMGYKEHPFMSPDAYRRLIFPAHARLTDYAHAHGLPVILHSDGFIEPLLPAIVEAGIDCLQPIEVKSGMDLLRIHRMYGEKIALMGGIDITALNTNDKEKIDRELESKIPVVKNGYGYILHSDHSIPPDVSYDTLRYFTRRALELGSYASNIPESK